jgi:hypothetical protein
MQFYLWSEMNQPKKPIFCHFDGNLLAKKRILTEGIEN